MHVMASLHSLTPIAITSFVVLLLTSLPPTTLSQVPSTAPSRPTIAECGPRLLPLAPCAPFVQATVPSPAQTCCDNLKQLYDQQPDCLCLLLNDTTISSFPINRTLALQLPVLCNLHVNISTCSGMSVVPSSPDSQVSFGTNNNSSVAASPTVQAAPRPSITGLGFSQSASKKLEMEYDLPVLLAIVTVFFLITVYRD